MRTYRRVREGSTTGWKPQPLMNGLPSFRPEDEAGNRRAAHHARLAPFRRRTGIARPTPLEIDPVRDRAKDIHNPPGYGTDGLKSNPKFNRPGSGSGHVASARSDRTSHLRALQSGLAQAGRSRTRHTGPPRKQRPSPGSPRFAKHRPRRLPPCPRRWPVLVPRSPSRSRHHRPDSKARRRRGRIHRCSSDTAAPRPAPGGECRLPRSGALVHCSLFDPPSGPIAGLYGCKIARSSEHTISTSASVMSGKSGRLIAPSKTRSATGKSPFCQ